MSEERQKIKEAQFDVFFAKLDEKKAVIEHLREENNLLFIENHRIAEVLLEDGYTIEDVNNISIGKPIDKGGK